MTSLRHAPIQFTPNQESLLTNLLRKDGRPATDKTVQAQKRRVLRKGGLGSKIAQLFEAVLSKTTEVHGLDLYPLTLSDVMQKMTEGAQILADTKVAEEQKVLAQASVNLALTSGRACKGGVLGVLSRPKHEPWRLLDEKNLTKEFPNATPLTKEKFEAKTVALVSPGGRWSSGTTLHTPPSSSLSKLPRRLNRDRAAATTNTTETANQATKPTTTKQKQHEQATALKPKKTNKRNRFSSSEEIKEKAKKQQQVVVSRGDYDLQSEEESSDNSYECTFRGCTKTFASRSSLASHTGWHKKISKTNITAAPPGKSPLPKMDLFGSGAVQSTTEAVLGAISTNAVAENCLSQQLAEQLKSIANSKQNCQEQEHQSVMLARFDDCYQSSNKEVKDLQTKLLQSAEDKARNSAALHAQLTDRNSCRPSEEFGNFPRSADPKS